MNGKILNEILQLGAKQALYREDGIWYHNLVKFPGVLFDKNGYVIFANKEEYYSTPNLQIKQDLHIKNGLGSLDKYIHFCYLDKLYIEENKYLREYPEKARRIRREIEAILRDRKLVDEIKLKYNNTCQICGLQLIIGKNKYYSEIHHIRPLGKPHNGYDTLDNMICVCPNCHILLDYNAISLDKNKFKEIKHDISEVNIKFHNSHIVK
jgi:5-methylcytosine-specific restriction protein A